MRKVGAGFLIVAVLILLPVVAFLFNLFASLLKFILFEFVVVVVAVVIISYSRRKMGG